VAKALDESKLRSRQRNAALALYIVGGLTLLLGLVAELGQVEALLQLFGSGWVVAVEGLILVVLGYFTARGSLLALGIAIGIYGIDAILTVVGGALQGIWLRALVLFFLVQGFIALRELKRRQMAVVSPASPSSTATASDPLPPRNPPLLADTDRQNSVISARCWPGPYPGPSSDSTASVSRWRRTSPTGCPGFTSSVSAIVPCGKLVSG